MRFAALMRRWSKLPSMASRGCSRSGRPGRGSGLRRRRQQHAAAGKVQDGQVLRMGVVIAQEHGECEPAQEVGDRPPLPLQRAEELGDPVRARAMGVTRRVRVLELRVVVDPVEAECLSSVLLVDQRDRLTVDSPVVALDDQVLAGTVADEFCAVVREPEFGGQRVAVVLPGEPVGASRKPRLEDVGGVRAAAGKVPVAVRTGRAAASAGNRRALTGSGRRSRGRRQSRPGGGAG